ncbi:DNA-processing protein DprA [Nocardia sp. CA-135398]|uniref:DNA-processing protein DprA n=1 Tax=Nocardia sp. CA-135398 TaxID=3239977 RepID=UPI003D962E25
MDTFSLRSVGTVMAALELLPAEPSDLSGILRDSDQRSMLLDRVPGLHRSPLTTYLCENIAPERVDAWSKELEMLCERKAVHTALAGTPAYPGRLAECWDAPPVLFTLGSAAEGPHVAIVGSRAASPDIVEDARRLAADLASAGVTIVSGLAAGIDTAAHEGALAVRGTTVAVMGTGIETIYPEQNTELAERIADSGMLVSQFAPRAPRTSTTFLKRNCVIAGMSDASVIMDGRTRSGSRHELEQAINYGRTALMWEPALAQEDWAKDFRDRGLATFVSSAAQVRRALEGIG